jgi:hypothetical protein
MEFIISEIKSKRENYHNRYYPAITGRECDILHLEPRRTGLLLIDVPYDPGNPHRFCTTPVLDIRELSDGTIVFETENSVYTLIPNRKESNNENV